MAADVGNMRSRVQYGGCTYADAKAVCAFVHGPPHCVRGHSQSLNILLWSLFLSLFLALDLFTCVCFFPPRVCASRRLGPRFHQYRACELNLRSRVLFPRLLFVTVWCEGRCFSARTFPFIDGPLHSYFPFPFFFPVYTICSASMLSSLFSKETFPYCSPRMRV